MAQVNLYLGAMNSGKTTQMLMAYHSYIENGKHPLIIKPCVDTRDGNIPENTFGKITSRVFQDGDVSALYINEFDKDFIFDLINEYRYDAVFCEIFQVETDHVRNFIENIAVSYFLRCWILEEILLIRR